MPSRFMRIYRDLYAYEGGAENVHIFFIGGKLFLGGLSLVS